MYIFLGLGIWLLIHDKIYAVKEPMPKIYTISLLLYLAIGTSWIFETQIKINVQIWNISNNHLPNWICFFKVDSKHKFWVTLHRFQYSILRNNKWACWHAFKLCMYFSLGMQSKELQYWIHIMLFNMQLTGLLVSADGQKPWN